MTNHPDNIPESWLSLLGERDASGWLAAFMENSRKAVADLIWNAFYFGPLNLTERGQLLGGWLDLLGNSESFATRLDEDISSWIEENWGRFDRRAESLLSAWSCLCGVVEFSAKLPDDSRLKKSAAALRARFGERKRFLGSFSTGPSADPLGLYLSVIAEFQGDDRTLSIFWHRMCFLPDDVPFYHARYAMLGLRRIKAIDPVEDGTLRPEIVLGLLQLALSFDRLARERGLDVNLAENTFRRVATQTAAAYPNSPRWREHGLAELQKLPERPQKWVRQALPPLDEAMTRLNSNTGQRQQPSYKSIEPNPNWSGRASALVARLKSGKLDCLPEVKRLLDEEMHYAEASGDSRPAVISLCRFASSVRRFSPKFAARWAEDALKLAPHDPFTWSTMRVVLLDQKRLDEALRCAWVAWKRFPENDVSCNDLADTLKTARRYDEAIAIYRRTIERFPNDPVARNGLGDVLRVLGRYDEAIAIYKETIDRFYDNFVEYLIARNGLAGTFRSAGRWSEAEAEYRRCVELDRADATTFVGLASLTLRKGVAGRAEALTLIKQALRLDPYHHQARKLMRQIEPASDADLNDLANKWEQVANTLFEPPSLPAIEDADLQEGSQPAPSAEAELPESLRQQAATHESEPTAPSAEEGEPHLYAPPSDEPVVEDKPIDEYEAATPEPEQSLSTPPPTAPSAKESKPQQVATRESEPTPPPAKESKPRLYSKPSDQPVVRDKPTGADEAAPPEPEQSLPPQTASLRSTHSVAPFEKEPQRAEPEVGPAEKERLLDDTGTTTPLKKKGPPQLQGTDPPESASVLPSAQEVAPQPRSNIYETISVAALVAEAYFYRTWARDAKNGDAPRRRRKAADLIDKAEGLAPQDAQVLAERISLSMTVENDAVIYGNLTAQLGSHSAAVPLLVLKARIDREKARRESRPLNNATLAELCTTPHRLRELNPILTPLFHFQKGLAALALLDGTVRIETAATAFSRFRRILSRRADEERKDREASRSRLALNFHEWLQEHVNRRVFAGFSETESLDIRSADISALEATWEQHPPAMEEVEDIFADRLAFAVI